MTISRKYVTPGELIVEGDYKPINNVIRVDDKFYATKIGLAEIGRGGIRVIPLSGPYIPRVDDLVIGKIVDYSAFSWEVDINSCFFAYLPAQNVFGRDFSPDRESLSKKFSIGDLIYAKVIAYNRTRDPLLSISGPNLGRIPKGEILKINSAKIPRLIGKKGSMIKTIESATNCKLIIGQNGIILITGPHDGILLANRAIKMVESEAHLASLTNKVQNFLSESKEV
ncbi:MAG: exosome complex RNA-binding protein Rrp4 [Candidatus Methylarchaceae archaeon HK01B]|nr:exosome complex RNA-binding protein Rrp4 [Candidatus Methylarchaceae archaeon HK01B]